MLFFIAILRRLADYDGTTRPFREFGSSPDIVGKTVTMSGEGYTIVGIIPTFLKEAKTEYARLQ
jgi:hypothetical protein